MYCMMLDNGGSCVYSGEGGNVIQGGIVVQKISIRIGQVVLIDGVERSHGNGSTSAHWKLVGGLVLLNVDKSAS